MEDKLEKCPTVFHMVLFGESKKNTEVPSRIRIGDGVVLHGEGKLVVKVIVVEVEGKENGQSNRRNYQCKHSLNWKRKGRS